MTQPIDVLLIEPSESDARRALAAIRRTAPGVSAVHVSGAEAAASLIFDYWPSETPQLPRLVMVDHVTAGQTGEAILGRLKSHAVTREVPTVLFSARFTPCAELDREVAGVLEKWLGQHRI